MIPVKYGSGYNLTMLEQAVAVISVYSNDGSIVVHQGGVDMGQGMMTKLEQVASYILNVPMELIRIESNCRREVRRGNETDQDRDWRYDP